MNAQYDDIDAQLAALDAERENDPREELDSPPDDPLAAIRAAILDDLNAGPAAIDNATPPRWICHPILPVAGANLAAPGGTGKTALTLSEMVHIVGGHELYGHTIEAQGPCVLITAEDGAARPRYVLQQMLQDGVGCGALPEGAARRAKQDIRIVGWRRDRFGPIVTIDPAGNFYRGAVFDLLLELLRPIQPVYVTLDPSVLFTAGERFGNDGDAFLAALLHDSALEIGACIQIVDHVAQSVARSGTIDQYAARGGTAKSDNARLARQLVRVTPALVADTTLPLSATSEDVNEGRLLQLHTTKSNYTPPHPPIWLRRRHFWIEHLRTPAASERAAAGRQELEARVAADAEIIIEYVRSQLSVGSGIRQTQRDLEGARPPRPDGSRLSRDRVRAAIGYATATGKLQWAALPTGEQHGARRSYLALPEGQP